MLIKGSNPFTPIMNTSYFAFAHDNPNAVSIAGEAPAFFKGRQFKKLAPRLKAYLQYKADGDEEAYIKAYNEQVLSKYDPHVILAELGNDAVLLCYEPPDEFCHRHLIADWLRHHTGIEITEL